MNLPLIERLLHRALSGHTIPTGDLPETADQSGLSLGEATILFGDATPRTERFALFSTLCRGDRFPTHSPTSIKASPLFRLEALILAS